MGCIRPVAWTRSHTISLFTILQNCVRAYQGRAGNAKIRLGISVGETRRYRNFAPFVRQTGERKAPVVGENRYYNN
jgi:hypothetical protein